MDVKSSSFTLLNRMNLGRSHSGLLQWKVPGSEQGVWERLEGAKNALTFWDGIFLSFFLVWPTSPGPWPRGPLQSSTTVFKWGTDSLRKQLLALGKKDKCSQLARPVGSPALGLERKTSLEYWETNPLASRVVSIFCSQQNCRRAQSFCQPIESKHSVFNLYYDKWKHTQIL